MVNRVRRWQQKVERLQELTTKLLESRLSRLRQIEEAPVDVLRETYFLPAKASAEGPLEAISAMLHPVPLPKHGQESKEDVRLRHPHRR